MDGSKAGVSLCMIVRDEADNLGRCLASVRPFVDEIVVVDTGSRDATPDIARQYGAVLRSLPWSDDFGLARNESFRDAAGEWILILDADEELPPATAQNLGRLTSGTGAEAWTFTIVSPCPACPAGQQLRQPGLRMFRNNAAYCFEGRIHEQIVPSIRRANPEAAVLYSGLEILHHGYNCDAEKRVEKTRRNLAILEQALARRPDDPFIHYNLGLTCQALGNLEESRKHYETARQFLDTGSVFAAAFFRNFSICLGDLGDYEQALDLVDEGLACFPDYPDLYFIRGQLSWELDQAPQAKAAFLSCLRFRRTPPEYITTEGVTGSLAQQNLVEICARQQEIDEALQHLEDLLGSRPSGGLYARLCSLLREKGLDGEEIAGRLEGFHLEHPAIARLLFDLQDFEACLTRLGSSGPVPAGGAPACAWEASVLEIKCLLRLGRYAEAASTLSSSGAWPSRDAEGLKLCCLALWLQTPRRDADAPIAAFYPPGHPAALACREINSLLFCGDLEPTGGIGGCKAPPGRGVHAPEVVEQILGLALEAFLSGDDDLSLVASLAGSAVKETGEARRTLGGYALKACCNREALQQLESALSSGRVTAGAHYLLGTACINLEQFDQALLHFLEANSLEPDNELYAACALEQLAGHCLLRLNSLLALDDGQTELRREAFRMAALRKRMLRIRESGSDPQRLLQMESAEIRPAGRGEGPPAHPAARLPC